MSGGSPGRLRHPSLSSSEEGTGRQVTGEQLVTGGAGNSAEDGGARGSITRAPAVPDFHFVHPRETTPPEDINWRWHPVRREWIGWTTETCLLCNKGFEWEGLLPIICGPCQRGKIRF